MAPVMLRFPLGLTLLAWLLACCILSAAASRQPENLNKPAVLQPTASRALQRARPRAALPPRTVFSLDQWNVELFNPNATDDYTDPGYWLRVEGDLGGGTIYNAGSDPEPYNGVGVRGSYLDATGAIIGSWECMYSGSAGSGNPPIGAKVLSKAVTITTSTTLQCSVSGGGSDPISCSAELLAGGFAKCAPNQDAAAPLPGNVFKINSQCHSVSDRIVSRDKGYLCKTDQATRTPMVVVSCGSPPRRYEITARSLSMDLSTGKLKGNASPFP